MPELHIRTARNGDHASIEKVALAAYEQYAAVIGQRFWQVYRSDIISTFSNPGTAEQIVAEQEGKIVGAVLLFPAGTTGELPDGSTLKLDAPEIRLLAVAPQARGQGIGKALMEECIRSARQAGASCVQLHTTDMMDVAMQMYEHRGFVRAQELDFHPVPNITIKGYRLSLERTPIDKP